MNGNSWKRGNCWKRLLERRFLTAFPLLADGAVGFEEL